MAKTPSGLTAAQQRELIVRARRSTATDLKILETVEKLDDLEAKAKLIKQDGKDSLEALALEFEILDMKKQLNEKQALLDGLTAVSNSNPTVIARPAPVVRVAPTSAVVTPAPTPPTAPVAYPASSWFQKAVEQIRVGFSTGKTKD